MCGTDGRGPCREGVHLWVPSAPPVRPLALPSWVSPLWQAGQVPGCRVLCHHGPPSAPQKASAVQVTSSPVAWGEAFPHPGPPQHSLGWRPPAQQGRELPWRHGGGGVQCIRGVTCSAPGRAEVFGPRCCMDPREQPRRQCWQRDPQSSFSAWNTAPGDLHMD